MFFMVSLMIETGRWKTLEALSGIVSAATWRAASKSVAHCCKATYYEVTLRRLGDASQGYRLPATLQHAHVIAALCSRAPTTHTRTRLPAKAMGA